MWGTLKGEAKADADFVQAKLSFWYLERLYNVAKRLQP